MKINKILSLFSNFDKYNFKVTFLWNKVELWYYRDQWYCYCKYKHYYFTLSPRFNNLEFYLSKIRAIGEFYNELQLILHTDQKLEELIVKKLLIKNPKANKLGIKKLNQENDDNSSDNNSTQNCQKKNCDSITEEEKDYADKHWLYPTGLYFYPNPREKWKLAELLRYLEEYNITLEANGEFICTIDSNYKNSHVLYDYSFLDTKKFNEYTAQITHISCDQEDGVVNREITVSLDCSIKELIESNVIKVRTDRMGIVYT